MEKKNKKRSDLINLSLGLLIIVLLNVLSQYIFTRIDLTKEKRYTLTESTREMLDSLDDVVYFKVYLEGNFPQGSGDYKRLRDETRIMLDEFRALGGDNIQYEFIDPGENPDQKARNRFHEQLISQGLIPHPETFTDDNGNQTTQMLFPWAVASYHQENTIIPLLGSSSPKPNEIVLNHAVEGLEYELSNAIRKLQMIRKPKIAITQGHGEPDTMELADLVKGLREYYQVDFVKLDGNLNAFRDTVQNAEMLSNKYTAVIVDGPDSTFSPADLFILDQFILYGGKALFLIDPVLTSMDSLAQTGMTLALPRQLGLDELLFRYGARLNSTLVDDLYCSQLMIPVSGPQTRFVPVPWYYSPTILPQETHPIVRNLDRIKFDFLSTVDTIETSANIKKTILLKSSDRSRFMRTPSRVSLKAVMMDPDRDPRTFDKPNQPVAVLLEGSFDSYYKGKFLPDTIKKSKLIGYKERSLRDSKIIVVGDGDVACNPVYQGQALKLGMDRNNRMNREFYANKVFLLNCVNYLCDDKGLLSVRSREVTLRLLDRSRVQNHRLKWQLINTLVPIAMLLVFGLVSFWLRRRKYVQGKELPKAVLYIFYLLLCAALGAGAYLVTSNWVQFSITFTVVLALIFGRWLVQLTMGSRRK